MPAVSRRCCSSSSAASWARCAACEEQHGTQQRDSFRNARCSDRQGVAKLSTPMHGDQSMHVHVLARKRKQNKRPNKESQAKPLPAAWMDGWNGRMHELGCLLACLLSRFLAALLCLPLFGRHSLPLCRLFDDGWRHVRLRSHRDLSISPAVPDPRYRVASFPHRCSTPPRHGHGAALTTTATSPLLLLRRLGRW